MITKKFQLNVALAAVTLGVLAFGMFTAWANVAKANPSMFAPTKATAAATSTLAYLAPGLATTTLTYDSLDGDSVKIDRLDLAIQYSASSTAPTLNVRLEDSPNNIDWYPRTVGADVSASTTVTTTSGFDVFSLLMATTTDNGGSGTSGRVHTSIYVHAPLRYVRAIFYVPTSGGNGGLWAQFNPIKEKP